MNTSKNALIARLSISEYADNLYRVYDESTDNRLEYYRMQARAVDADFIYCLNSELENQLFPYIYIYDERDKIPQRNLATINKQLWTIGEIALAIVVYDDEIKIIDARQPISLSVKGDEEAKILHAIPQIESKLKIEIFEGRIIEKSDRDYVSISPYNMLLDHIDKNILGKQKDIRCSNELLRKLVVKCILVKYIEEQVDECGQNIFKDKYFNTYLSTQISGVATFCDVIRAGNIAELFKALNDKFNGGIFELNEEQKAEIQQCNLNPIATALDGHFDINGQGSLWAKYDLKLLPIEFISRLYEKFVTSSEGSQKDYGAYYTPPHLARLLVDELLPFNSQIDFDTFKLIDPSCGSGVFLVLAYKRLITLWMLKNKKRDIQGREDIVALQEILKNCIFGIDINGDAVSITATSLQIELTSHLQPKDINLLHFDNLQENGNLKECGFFKWYKTETQRFDVVVGNPPFNIDNEENLKVDIDDDIKQEYFITVDSKKHAIPNNNPAMAFFNASLKTLLKDDSGRLFMVMPSTAMLYNTNSVSIEFRKAIFSNWDVRKIYDFTPLRDHLWSGAAVATVAVCVHQKNKLSTNSIKHIVVRNSLPNKNGAIRFQIDKYDTFTIPISIALHTEYIWKSNLLGGGRLVFYINKYRQAYSTLKAFLDQKRWLYQDGAKSSQKEGKDIAALGYTLLKSKEVLNDTLEQPMLDQNPTGKYRLDNETLYSSPNVLIKSNANQGLPTIFNKDKTFIFDNTFFGIKCTNEDLPMLEMFVDIFKANRYLYKFLITVTSSKTFLQKAGNSLINSKDLKSLPINTDDSGNPIPFEPMSHIEQAVLEDTEMMAQCLNKTTGRLFDNVKIKELTQYGSAFCEILNFVYENRDYLFRPIRCIIHDDYVWMSFEHTNVEKEMELQLSDLNKDIYQNILHDDISNLGLRINRIITSYSESNKVSFIKPRALKYWTRSIGYRDAENVKAEMFSKGF